MTMRSPFVWTEEDKGLRGHKHGYAHLACPLTFAGSACVLLLVFVTRKQLTP